MHKKGFQMRTVFYLLILLIPGISCRAQTQVNKPVNDHYTSFNPGQPWYDSRGEVINAHGGGLLYSGNTYYWFGERRGKQGTSGVNVYSSQDLYNWKYEALALSTDSANAGSDIAPGCVMERPKVIYNARTRKYVMWFHLELKGKGYSAARAGVAVSDKVTGPYKFINSFRPNGNMSRDMTLFVDDDGSAWHMYSSQENYDLRIARLTNDYLQPTTEDKLLFSAHREAPALFKYDGKYYLITSGCTGWAPNKATVHTANSLTGPWTLMNQNPMLGPGADTTFGAQSTYIQPIAGKKNAFLFMADKWNPHDLRDSRYLWLPLHIHNGQPLVEWMHNWDLNLFGKTNTHETEGYQLVWADEFNKDGRPDSTRWGYEYGLVRNEEFQWYQSENAVCKNGQLVIEVRREEKVNPNYTANHKDWRKNRPKANYTSSCLLTAGKASWLYGRFELRARIDIRNGIWPAWWTLGVDKPWPGNGEIDIMEYYRGRLLANIACLGNNKRPEWFSKTFPVDSLGGSTWANQFHVWRMDWTEEYIALYVDGYLLNKVSMDVLANKDGSGFNPFKQPHYMLLNVAIGGQNGGDPTATTFPSLFEIDYVRVYQKK
ncbi:family 43 glycosylhydrolase [Niastella sp. OAS944]|uniref:family 43 glycosylhydrolase n=1 Tax=Niastella sp. OAS944 TaxID=2664089 RepID=UPI003482B7C5|nr:beta-glucanase (GH16 family) [Chitinophagaceae bacterium OAS944]